MTTTRRLLTAFGTASTVLALGAASALPAAASSTIATATLSGAASPTLLSDVTPTWTLTLDGTDRAALASTASTVDVADATGTGAGWNVTLSGTALTSGGRTLAQPSISAAATFACDSGSTCTAPVSNTTAGTMVTYPFTVGTSAAKFYSANANTGLGRATGTNTWSLAVPASTYAGTYNGTWAYSVVSGP